MIMKIINSILLFLIHHLKPTLVVTEMNFLQKKILKDFLLEYQQSQIKKKIKCQFI